MTGAASTGKSQDRRFVSPRELRAELEEAAAGLPPGAFIRNPKYQHLKDIWCAAHFGIGYERHVAPCTLWVNSEQSSDTDFVLRVSAMEFPFQTTLADVPGRRMGEEHKLDPSNELRLSPYEPGKGSAEGPDWIAAAVRRKIAANYSRASTLNLLVYANFSTNGLDYEAIRSTVDPFVNSFGTIWIVTNHQIGSVGRPGACGALAALQPIYDLAELMGSGGGDDRD